MLSQLGGQDDCKNSVCLQNEEISIKCWYYTYFELIYIDRNPRKKTKQNYTPDLAIDDFDETMH